MRRRTERNKAPEPAHSRRRAAEPTSWLALGLSIATALALVTHFTSPGAGGPGSAAEIGTHATRIQHPPATALTGAVDHDAQPATHKHPPATPTTIARSRARAATSAKPQSQAAPQRTRPPGLVAVTTTTTTTTTATATATTTTTPPTPAPSVRPRVAQMPDASAIEHVDDQWAGSLSYPDDVTTSYSFTTAGGSIEVLARTTAAAVPLSAKLRCHGAGARTATGSTVRLQMSSMTPAGSCTLSIGLAPSDLAPGAAAGYRIDARYATDPNAAR